MTKIIVVIVLLVFVFWLVRVEAESFGVGKMENDAQAPRDESGNAQLDREWPLESSPVHPVAKDAPEDYTPYEPDDENGFFEDFHF